MCLRIRRMRYSCVTQKIRLFWSWSRVVHRDYEAIEKIDSRSWPKQAHVPWKSCLRTAVQRFPSHTSVEWMNPDFNALVSIAFWQNEMQLTSVTFDQVVQYVRFFYSVQSDQVCTERRAVLPRIVPCLGEAGESVARVPHPNSDELGRAVHRDGPAAFHPLQPSGLKQTQTRGHLVQIVADLADVPERPDGQSLHHLDESLLQLVQFLHGHRTVHSLPDFVVVGVLLGKKRVDFVEVILVAEIQGQNIGRAIVHHPVVTIGVRQSDFVRASTLM